MTTRTPTSMRAVVLDRFGGPEELQMRVARAPDVGPGELLVQVQAAGVGRWDPFEREGGYARMIGMEARFPYVLGSEGAGRIVALGEGVSGHTIGEEVYAVGFRG